MRFAYDNLRTHEFHIIIRTHEFRVIVSEHMISPLMLWVWISIRARCTSLCDKVCQWLVAGQWFSLGPPVSSTNITDLHNITEIFLKVALNTIKPTKLEHTSFIWWIRNIVQWAFLALIMCFHLQEWMKEIVMTITIRQWLYLSSLSKQLVLPWLK